MCTSRRLHVVCNLPFGMVCLSVWRIMFCVCVIIGRSSDVSVHFVVHDARLYSVLYTVISGDDICRCVECYVI